MFGLSTFAPLLSSSHFSSARTKLSVKQGCLMWGLRTVIPPSLQKQILSELHKAHPGVARMKAAARSHVWLPGIDSDIEETSTRLQAEFQNQKGSTRSTTVPLVMAYSSMAAHTCRLCYPSVHLLLHYG